jgi:hypothetical protein
MKMTGIEKIKATAAAAEYIAAKRDMNNAGMISAADKLFGLVGYWLNRKTTTAGEFRGDIIPPKMARMPAGQRNIRWDSDRVAAAWAGASARAGAPSLSAWAEDLPVEASSPTAQRYEIDAAGMGSEWQGDLDSFADVLQELAGPAWDIVAITGMYNGANNTDPETGDMIDFPESIWLAALDKHAAAHPEMWACS